MSSLSFQPCAVSGLPFQPTAVRGLYFLSSPDRPTWAEGGRLRLDTFLIFGRYGPSHPDLCASAICGAICEPYIRADGLDEWNREPLRSELAQSSRLVLQALRHAYAIPDDQTLETTYVDREFVREAFANIPLMSTPLDLCADRLSRLSGSIEGGCVHKIIRAAGLIFSLMLLVPEALYQALARTVAKVGIFVFSFFNQTQAEWLRVRLDMTPHAGTQFRNIGLRLGGGW